MEDKKARKKNSIAFLEIMGDVFDPLYSDSIFFIPTNIL